MHMAARTRRTTARTTRTTPAPRIEVPLTMVGHKGETARIGEVWGGHAFTPLELETLASGAPVRITTGTGVKRALQLEQDAHGNWRLAIHGSNIVVGGPAPAEPATPTHAPSRTERRRGGHAQTRPAREEHDDKTYVTYAPTGEKVVVRRVWGGHLFTGAELDALAAGLSVKVVTDKGRELAVRLVHDERRGLRLGIDEEHSDPGRPMLHSLDSRRHHARH